MKLCDNGGEKKKERGRGKKRGEGTRCDFFTFVILVFNPGPGEVRGGGVGRGKEGGGKKLLHLFHIILFLYILGNPVKK